MPAGLENQLITFLTNHISWIGVFIIMALESANIPIPSEITMPLAGWLLVRGTGDVANGSAIQALIEGGLIGGLGCTIGSVISYAIGLYGGRPLVERYGKYILVSQSDIDRADKWFARWGDWASFISRLLPFVRTFISLPAGIVRVNFPRFVILSFIGSVIWCAILSVAGYALGNNFRQISDVIRPIEYPIIAIIVLGLVYYIYRHIRHAQSENRRTES